MAEKKQNASKTGFVARLSKMQSEIAVGVALALAAAGFTLAQLDVDLPFQWCPAGTVDRVECFRGWLVSSAGWIAAIFAYLTIRQVRKQVENLEDEVEKNSAAEKQSALRSFKNEMFNFRDLELQLFQNLAFALKSFEENAHVEAEVYPKIASLLAQLNGYDWSRLRYLERQQNVNAQIELLQSLFAKIQKSLGEENRFIETARHYVFVRGIFYEKIQEATGIDFGEA